MNAVIAVAVGGAAGSVARYLTIEQVARWVGVHFPWGTLTVNVAGSLLMGVLAGIAMSTAGLPEGVRAFAAVGFLGGFTTFSSFSLDIFNLIERGAPAGAFAYVAASITAGIAALYLGVWLVRWVAA